MRPVGSPRAAIDAAIDRRDSTTRELFADANLVGLYLARSGRVDEARSLMQKEIVAASRVPAALVWSLDAWVNVARLDVMSGDLTSGSDHYRSLILLCAWKGDDTGLPFGRRELISSTSDRTTLTTAVRALRNGVVADVCRLQWRTGQTARLRTCADRFHTAWPDAVGAGRDFPIEAILLLDPLGRGEPLPDDVPEHAAVRLLHQASYEVWRHGSTADSLLESAADAVAEHVTGCAGCTSCVDWLTDLGGTLGHACLPSDERLSRAAHIAIDLGDHAGLARLEHRAPEPLRRDVGDVLARMAPDQSVLTAACELLDKRLENLTHDY